MKLQDELAQWKLLSPSEFCGYILKKHLSFRTIGFSTLSLILFEIAFIPGAAPLT